MHCFSFRYYWFKQVSWLNDDLTQNLNKHTLNVIDEYFDIIPKFVQTIILFSRFLFFPNRYDRSKCWFCISSQFSFFLSFSFPFSLIKVALLVLVHNIKRFQNRNTFNRLHGGECKHIRFVGSEWCLECTYQTMVHRKMCMSYEIQY